MPGFGHEKSNKLIGRRRFGLDEYAFLVTLVENSEAAKNWSWCIPIANCILNVANTSS